MKVDYLFFGFFLKTKIVTQHFQSIINFYFNAQREITA
jgi:hypothetical protein